MMWNFRNLLPLLLLLLCLFPNLSFAEDEPGKTIHDRDCMGCHGVEMYTRDGLFVKSYKQLQAQVAFWVEKNGLTWTEDETDEVLDYLADTFYGFE